MSTTLLLLVGTGRTHLRILSFVSNPPSPTGGSAAAAGSLVNQLGGTLVGYLFIVEIPFLKGREKLDNIPVVTLLDVNE